MPTNASTNHNVAASRSAEPAPLFLGALPLAFGILLAIAVLVR